MGIGRRGNSGKDVRGVGIGSSICLWHVSLAAAREVLGGGVRCIVNCLARCRN